MSRHFDAAVEIVLKHEGKFSNNKKDPGGATNWGISLRYLKSLEKETGSKFAIGDVDMDGDVDAEDIRKLTREQAVEIYRKYWKDSGMPAIEKAISSGPIVIKIFDTAVNAGPNQAFRLLQRALRACTGDAIADDGVVGAQTLAAVESALPGSILAAYRSEQAGFYRSLVAQNPTRQEFIVGWLNRAYS